MCIRCGFHLRFRVHYTVRSGHVPSPLHFLVLSYMRSPCIPSIFPAFLMLYAMHLTVFGYTQPRSCVPREFSMHSSKRLLFCYTVHSLSVPSCIFSWRSPWRSPSISRYFSLRSLSVLLCISLFVPLYKTQRVPPAGFRWAPSYVPPAFAMGSLCICSSPGIPPYIPLAILVHSLVFAVRSIVGSRLVSFYVPRTFFCMFSLVFFRPLHPGVNPSVFAG